VERALRERWRIPKRMRGSLINRLGRILDDAGAGAREVTSAARAILAASKVNLENVSVAAKMIEQRDLEARMTEIERMIAERHESREAYTRGQACTD
jgi:hypothetical protein